MFQIYEFRFRIEENLKNDTKQSSQTIYFKSNLQPEINIFIIISELKSIKFVYLALIIPKNDNYRYTYTFI